MFLKVSKPTKTLILHQVEADMEATVQYLNYSVIKSNYLGA